LSIKIILADDHKIVRDGLRSLLERHPGMEVIAETSDGRAAVQLSLKYSPDVVIIDVAMPVLNGIEATRRIKAESPGTKVIALSMHSDRRFVVEMLNAGASGYLLKECAFEELVGAVHSILAGNNYLSPSITDVAIKDKHCGHKEASGFFALTPRELEVLQLLVEGRTTLQIADMLRISEKTIIAHRRNIFSKLGIQSLAELIKYAIREGFTLI